MDSFFDSGDLQADNWAQPDYASPGAQSSQSPFLNYLGGLLQNRFNQNPAPQPPIQQNSGLMFPWRTQGKQGGQQQQSGNSIGGILRGAAGIGGW